MHPVAAPDHRFRPVAPGLPPLRALVQENHLTASDFIWPVFVRDGVGLREPINAMPGVARLSVDLVVEAAQEAAELGIPAICLFPYTDARLKTLDCERREP